MRLRHYDSTPSPYHGAGTLGSAFDGNGSSLRYLPSAEFMALLANQGMDVWLCDFGSPETEEDGLKQPWMIT